MEQICQLFGKYSDEDTVFDYLIDVYFEENTFSRENEILLILNQVILGAKKIKDYIIDELLNFYLNSNKTCVPLEVGEDNSVNMRKAYSNIVKVCHIITLG